MLKALYVDTVIHGGFKAFENYNRFMKYDIDLVRYQNHDLFENVYHFLEPNMEENYTELFYPAFFIESFKKANNSFKNVEKDYEYLKDELPFTVDWSKFYETVTKLDKAVEEIKMFDVDYILIRVLGPNTFSKFYMCYRFYNESNIKLIVGRERDFYASDYLHSTFNNVCDHLFYGYGEYVLDAIHNNTLEDFDLNYNFTDNMYESYNFNITDIEIKTKQYYLMPNMKCPNRCGFCTTNKEIVDCTTNTEDRLYKLADYMMYVNKKYEIKSNTFVSSLAFRTSNEIKMFFTYLLEHDAKLPLGITYLTAGQYLDNMDLLIQYPAHFGIGVDHVSESVLRRMKKPTNKEILTKILFTSRKANVAFNFLYNYFGESKEEFDEMLLYYRILTKGKYGDIPFYKIVWSSTGDTWKQDEIEYKVKFIEPVKTKEYFNIDHEFFFFRYINNHDPDYSLLKYKLSQIKKKGLNHLSADD